MASAKRNSKRLLSRQLFALICSALSMLALLGCYNKPPVPPEPTPPGGHSAPVAGAPAAAPLPCAGVSATPQVEILDVFFRKAFGDSYFVATTMANPGSAVAEVNGGCSWKCPAPIKQQTGGLTSARGEYLSAKGKRTLTADTMSVCDNNPLPVPLSCSFKVAVHPNNSKAVCDTYALSWSGSASIANPAGGK
jgi:hypothetical protein